MATTITAITGSAVSAGNKARRQFQALFEAIPFEVTLEDDTLPAQTSSQVDVAVPGAELGDFVLIAPGVDSAGIVVSAVVSAADVVTVTFFNTEGSDAVTAFATPSVAKGVVLKPSAGVFGEL